MESLTKKEVESSQPTMDSSLSHSLKEVNPIQDKKEMKNEPKKFTGVLNFINEKLSEWPLWIKTNLFNEQKVSETSEKEPKEKAKPKIRKALETSHLPERHYFSRTFPPITYNYYHNKDDGKTYFYPFASKDAKGKEIFEIPEMENEKTLRNSYTRENFNSQSFYVHHIEPVQCMKTSVAIEKIKESDQYIC